MTEGRVVDSVAAGCEIADVENPAIAADDDMPRRDAQVERGSEAAVVDRDRHRQSTGLMKGVDGRGVVTEAGSAIPA
jgi:hypothetical protein